MRSWEVLASIKPILWIDAEGNDATSGSGTQKLSRVLEPIKADIGEAKAPVSSFYQRFMTLKQEMLALEGVGAILDD